VGDFDVITGLSRYVSRAACGAAALAAAMALVPSSALAQQSVSITGRVEPGIWIDPDGCMHWVADGGAEGYMEGRVNPVNGMPVCLDVNTCAVANNDVLFHTDSARLTPSGRAYLEQFFRSAGAFAYAIYGHTDSRASDEYNMRLSQNRAAAVAQVARASGARVAREIGYGERRPVASNATASGMQQNRRVEIVCYR
jgi:outer membrane protein OmpA-like peptidoglycan-associated protein